MNPNNAGVDLFVTHRDSGWSTPQMQDKKDNANCYVRFFVPPNRTGQ